ncbi:MAG: aspartate carbamoyltransferase catalytic subunit [Candidatus Zixiibacteriota bacterium]
MKFTKKHLLGIEELSREEILLILETARSFLEVMDRKFKKVPPLRGRTIANMFFEPSTRTLNSFLLAEKRVSADSINFSAKSSSISKGESLRDTIENIEAMRVDMMVVRHASPGASHFISKHTNAAVINAGDGPHEHPTQALLDFYTMAQHFDTFEGLKVVILGDVLHSRVARSNILGLVKLGADVTLCGPPTLMPREFDNWDVKYRDNLEEAINGANVVNILRLQLERQHHGFIPSLREYHNRFGMSTDELDLLDKDHIIMHPGPMNRGVEITSSLADHHDAVILPQVTNGVAVRMAVLYLLSQNLD